MKDLYSILQLEKDATLSDIRKQYYKLSRIHHPDKKGEKEAFQELSRAYAILGDPEKRKHYDLTGSESIEGIADWEAHWRSLFDSFTLDDIEAFKRAYQQSDEERDDIYNAYTRFKGDMDKIMESIMLSSTEDEDRFRTLLKQGIDDGTLKAYKKFTHEPAEKRERRRKREKKDKEEYENLGDLAAIIKKRAGDRFEKTINRLEEKYGT